MSDSRRALSSDDGGRPWLSMARAEGSRGHMATTDTRPGPSKGSGVEDEGWWKGATMCFALPSHQLACFPSARPGGSATPPPTRRRFARIDASEQKQLVGRARPGDNAITSGDASPPHALRCRRPHASPPAALPQVSLACTALKAAPIPPRRLPMAQRGWSDKEPGGGTARAHLDFQHPSTHPTQSSQRQTRSLRRHLRHTGTPATSRYGGDANHPVGVATHHPPNTHLTSISGPSRSLGRWIGELCLSRDAVDIFDN